MIIKQVLVLRKDLNMRKGKMVTQGSHSCMKVFFDRMTKNNLTYTFTATEEMAEWIDGKFTKICVSVNSEEELLDIYNKAKEANLPCTLIEDCGLTEFKGVPTKTCCAIGPVKEEEVDPITKHLPLL